VLLLFTLDFPIKPRDLGLLLLDGHAAGRSRTESARFLNNRRHWS
jgi:hypothetical protein